MLGSAGPLDRDLVKEWMSLDWQSQWPGPAAKRLRDSLERHLAALLDQPLEKVPLDGALIEDARRTFSRVSLAERVYSTIKGSQPARALPPWRPADAAGASGVRVFIRSSGAPLTEACPASTPSTASTRCCCPTCRRRPSRSPAKAGYSARRRRSTGQPAGADPATRRDRALHGGVCQAMGRPAGRPRHRADAQPAAGGAGPVHPGLAAIADARPAGRHHPAAHADAAAATAARCRRSRPGRGAGGDRRGGAGRRATPPARCKVCSAANGPPPEPPGKAIEDRYAALIAFVGKGPGAPIDNVLKLLNDLQMQLAKLAGAPAGGAAAALGGGDDPAQLLQAEASRDPQPVARWLQAIAISGNQLRGGGALDQAKKEFGAPGGPASLCSKAVTGRYPFTPGSTNDIPLDDFAKLFAAGGLLDKFFNDNLQTFVDTSGADLEGAAGGRRRAAGHTGRPGAVPASVADPRPVLRRRRQPADCPVRYHADRYRREAGDARPGWPEHPVCARAEPRRRR